MTEHKSCTRTSNAHKTCKRTMRTRIKHLQYIVYLLKTMKQDDCPALKNVTLDDFDKLQKQISELRGKLFYGRIL